MSTPARIKCMSVGSCDESFLCRRIRATISGVVNNTIAARHQCDTCGPIIGANCGDEGFVRDRFMLGDQYSTGTPAGLRFLTSDGGQDYDMNRQVVLKFSGNNCLAKFSHDKLVQQRVRRCERSNPCDVTSDFTLSTNIVVTYELVRSCDGSWSWAIIIGQNGFFPNNIIGNKQYFIGAAYNGDTSTYLHPSGCGTMGTCFGGVCNGSPCDNTCHDQFNAGSHLSISPYIFPSGAEQIPGEECSNLPTSITHPNSGFSYTAPSLGQQATAFYGGSHGGVTFEVLGCCDETDAHDCTYCVGCSSDQIPGCILSDSCCTPETIRSTTSAVTNCISQCITGTNESYKLSGATAINATRDLSRTGLTSCIWRNDVSSDHVLTKATKHTLSTLVYEAERTSNEVWTNRVYARDSGDTIRVYFFDGTINTGSGSSRCSDSATSNNTISCDLCASPKTAGNSGTFAKPSTTGLGTACGNCDVVDTPASFSATVASVVTCVDTCECTNRWKLTGTTAVNRSITISQVGGSPCLLRGTVSADYVLYDHDTAAATFNISTMRYELVRTGSTTATWNITGRDGATQRIVYATGTSAVSANNCNTWGTSTHTNPGCSADSTNDTAVMGTAGSTAFTSCP